jgi:hypothetical protein
LHEKRIGSWFSLASPIKTTAGFLIKSELRLFRYPAPSCHLDQRERSQCNTGDWDEEEEFCPLIDANLCEKKLRLFVVSALLLQHPALFWINSGIKSLN